MSGPGTPAPVVGVARSRVEWVDTDAAGIHHHSTVVRRVEAAEGELVRGLGLGLGLDGWWPVVPRVRWEVDYLAPLLPGQEVVTTVTVAEVGGSSLRLDFEVWGEAHADRPRRLAARGSYVVVHLDPARSAHAEGAAGAPWPEAWRAALAGGAGGV